MSLISGAINENLQRRRFDACAGDNVYDHFTVYIQHKTSASGNWRDLTDPERMGYRQRFSYFSHGGGYYRRMLVSRPSSGAPKSYGVGGAWSPPPPLTSGL